MNYILLRVKIHVLFTKHEVMLYIVDCGLPVILYASVLFILSTAK